MDWAEGGLPGYRTALELSAKDRDGLALDVAMALSAAKVRVPTLSAKAMRQRAGRVPAPSRGRRCSR